MSNCTLHQLSTAKITTASDGSTYCVTAVLIEAGSSVRPISPRERSMQQALQTLVSGYERGLPMLLINDVLYKPGQPWLGGCSEELNAELTVRFTLLGQMILPSNNQYVRDWLKERKMMQEKLRLYAKQAMLAEKFWREAFEKNYQSADALRAAQAMRDVEVMLHRPGFYEAMENYGEFAGMPRATEEPHLCDGREKCSDDIKISGSEVETQSARATKEETDVRNEREKWWDDLDISDSDYEMQSAQAAAVSNNNSKKRLRSEDSGSCLPTQKKQKTNNGTLILTAGHVGRSEWDSEMASEF
ncbi:hypothetical protein BJ878DRAFT_483337 [Calycina marina]|uniref:Uncharacterized protein n=1 Tax=Calycina marina TaxID=1763456 RepID=A0A9P8CBV6_9HELO|nr:hypothetical protein BJ878DRAFT_483337 [Calycina marina]